ncbi:MAG: hypothetical protein HYZ00_02755, partial [Candidatus Hydrogenedentes bacterium]|nr:hypothetical protein [Candidatus Hydrogenedentota bacterium]
MPDDLAVQIRLRERMRTSRWLTWLVVLYVAAVLTVDALATLHVRWGTDWSQFDWGPREARQFLQGLGLPKGAFSFLYEGAMRNFDWFKFFTWFLAPFLFALPNMVWSALSFKRWKIHDVMMLLVIAGVGMLIMLFIPFMPEFRDLYLGNVPAAQRSAFLFAQLAWIVSWLPGWEFMHRYVLLDRVSMTWPRYGWFLL